MAMPGKMRATFIPTGTKMLFPAPPKGATGWKLVVNGKTYNVKVATKYLIIRGLKHRTKYRWYLNAVAGNAISNTASSAFTTPK
jgi:hypothetical protein